MTDVPADQLQILRDVAAGTVTTTQQVTDIPNVRALIKAGLLAIEDRFTLVVTDAGRAEIAGSDD